MKKVVKYLLKLCVITILLLGSFNGLTVQADELRYGDFEYSILGDGTVEIAEYITPEENAPTEISIPSEIEGRSVTSIRYNAFSGCSGLTSIEIPDSVTSIGTLVFYECSGLTSIEIPDSVMSFGYGAFEGCSGLTSIKIPDSVTFIGNAAFARCSGLTSIEFPDSVTSIEDDTFYFCSSLTSIEIPSCVISIGWNAFYNCNNLKDVYYTGNKSQWQKISIDSEGNDVLATATIHYNSKQSNTTEDNNSNPSNSDTTKDDTADKTDTTDTTDKTDTTIALSNVKLSYTQVTYNGKAKKPTVIITDTNQKTVDAANYTLTYTNNKNVGQATVTVTGKNNYTGTLTATFKIIPKGTTLSKVTAKKKAFAVKWKKQTKQTTGYQIQYATDKNFKKAKNITVKKNKTVSATVKKLKANKKYYVRIRTYKTVKINGKTTKLYSDWSKSKMIKTKK